MINKTLYTNKKRTKIVATLGPSITGKIFTWEAFKASKNEAIIKEAYENVEQLFLRGVNIFRLNFSHGDHEEQEIRIHIVREVAAKLGITATIMLDTKGPEIRVCKMEKDDIYDIMACDFVEVHCREKILGNSSKFSVTDSTGAYDMSKDLIVDNLILVDDGKLQLKILEIDSNTGIVKTQALNSHRISEKKRINLPNTNYTMPFISKKDKEDIKFAVKNKLDFIALSFVNKAQDIIEVRNILSGYKAPDTLQIIAKIESTNAINNIDEIINETNGIMVARGDLGLEIPFYNIPYWEKYLIKHCRFVGKPCIVATQMLDSLEKNIQPTRAEVTDVFFAVDKGADATMLSGETAQGMFPLNAVSTMATINSSAEKIFDYKRSLKFYYKKSVYPAKEKKLAKKIAKKVMPNYSDVANPYFAYDFVFIATNNKELIWAIANIRPAASIIVLTTDKEIMRMFNINYGIQMELVKVHDLETKGVMYIASEVSSKYELTKALVVNEKNRLVKLDAKKIKKILDKEV